MKRVSVFLAVAVAAAIFGCLPADARRAPKPKPTRPPATTTTRPPVTTTVPTTTLPPVTTTLPSGYLFDDEFTGTALDTSKWWANPWCENDPNYMEFCQNPANVSVSGGVLHLLVTAGTMGRPYDGAQVDSFVRGSWPPATVKAAVAPPVHIEARMKLAGPAGLWPSFWPQSVDPLFIELDIQESPMAHPTVDTYHVHGLVEYDNAYDAGVDLSTDFHTYWANYYPDRITFGFDGVTLATASFPRAAPRVGMVLGNAVGSPGTWGGEGGPPALSSLPADLQVDYVRAWAI